MSRTTTSTLSTSRWIDPKIFPLLLVNFIGALGYSVILPFLVFLVIDFGGNEIMYGLIGSLYPMFQMVGAPILGSWSDRIGRKKVLLISQAGTFLSWCIFLVAFTTPVQELLSFTSESFGLIVFTLPLLILMLARAFDGLTGGNISVANAYLADITEPSERKANYGKLSAAMSLGFIIGPALAGLLAALPSGKILTVIASASISFIGIFIIQFFLPDVNPCGEKNLKGENEDLKKLMNCEIVDCTAESPEIKHNVWKLDRMKFFIILYFLIFLTFNFFHATFPVHASENLKWNSSSLGIFFTLLSGVIIVTQTYLLPNISKQVSDGKLFITGNLLLAIGFFCMTFQSTTLLYASAVLYGLGNGLMWPTYLGMLSQIGDKNQQGKIQGIAGSAGGLASVIGLIAGGFIFSLISANIFLVSMVGILVIALLGVRFLKTEVV
ncbi:MAG: MFS transporter [Bacteroidota bacterium]